MQERPSLSGSPCPQTARALPVPRRLSQPGLLPGREAEGQNYGLPPGTGQSGLMPQGRGSQWRRRFYWALCETLQTGLALCATRESIADTELQVRGEQRNLHGTAGNEENIAERSSACGMNLKSLAGPEALRPGRRQPESLRGGRAAAAGQSPQPPARPSSAASPAATGRTATAAVRKRTIPAGALCAARPAPAAAGHTPCKAQSPPRGLTPPSRSPRGAKSFSLPDPHRSLPLQRAERQLPRPMVLWARAPITSGKKREAGPPAAARTEHRGKRLHEQGYGHWDPRSSPAQRPPSSPATAPLTGKPSSAFSWHRSPEPASSPPRLLRRLRAGSGAPLAAGAERDSWRVATTPAAPPTSSLPPAAPAGPVNIPASPRREAGRPPGSASHRCYPFPTGGEGSHAGSGS